MFKMLFGIFFFLILNASTWLPSSRDRKSWLYSLATFFFQRNIFFLCLTWHMLVEKLKLWHLTHAADSILNEMVTHHSAISAKDIISHTSLLYLLSWFFFFFYLIPAKSRCLYDYKWQNLGSIWLQITKFWWFHDFLDSNLLFPAVELAIGKHWRTYLLFWFRQDKYRTLKG